MKLIVFDPGKTTGFCVWRVDNTLVPWPQNPTHYTMNVRTADLNEVGIVTSFTHLDELFTRLAVEELPPPEPLPPGKYKATTGEPIPMEHIQVLYENISRANAADKDQVLAIQMGGGIVALAVHHHMNVRPQDPSVRHGYIADAKKVADAFNIHGDLRVHIVDALAHAIRYFTKEGITWHMPSST